MAKFCTNCGQELDSKASFCYNCGTKVGGTNKEETSSNTTQNIRNNTTNNSTTQKSKIVAGLLGIFLGSMGIHNFYLGYNNKAVAQLLITVLSCGLLSLVSGIWGLVEGIQILTGTIDIDADGNPLGE